MYVTCFFFPKGWSVYIGNGHDMHVRLPRIRPTRCWTLILRPFLKWDGNVHWFESAKNVRLNLSWCKKSIEKGPARPFRTTNSCFSPREEHITGVYGAQRRAAATVFTRNVRRESDHIHTAGLMMANSAILFGVAIHGDLCLVEETYVKSVGICIYIYNYAYTYRSTLTKY